MQALNGGHNINFPIADCNQSNCDASQAAL